MFLAEEAVEAVKGFEPFDYFMLAFTVRWRVQEKTCSPSASRL